MKTGLFHNPRDAGNLPAGKVSIAPVEGAANGLLVIDGSMVPFGALKIQLG